jgi:WD40 repeat protein/serine/threonine protein kinase
MGEETLFHQALERPAAERAAFLEHACGGDDELRRRVEALLHAHDNPGSFLGKPPVNLGGAADSQRGQPGDAEAPGTHPIPEGPGSCIGPYKLLQRIGEGGMGAVFMAEQTEPVQRRVALKVVKPGMDSDQVLARFEAERQALALMDHPNIARVLDAGTTDSGRPYFVMELVKGVPITKYCDEHRLTPRQRLELFVPVCRAVQHAHTKGIIHRDLKPSNVLIALYDDRPVPKVIDFGVAKAMGPKLTDKTLFTEFGAVVGTLEYMSPEQAQLNQLDIDTRSDVYSLGVLLYELLTGTTPLERRRLKEAALLEVLRLIREEEPPRPSMRLSTTQELPAIAASRGLEPRRLSGLVRGELDWIAMKCLEKDRNLRYETADGLARDVERYLADEPVQAGPPSAGYRLRKYVRRHKGQVLAAALLTASLIAGTAVSWYFAFQAESRARDYREEKDRANAEAEKARNNEERARHRLYVTRMAPVPRLWKEGKLRLLVEALEEQLPEREAEADRRDLTDLRGWEWHYQWRLSHAALRTLRAHPPSHPVLGCRHAVAFSPDGRWLASGGGGRFQTAAEVALWDLVTGKELRRFPAHARQIVQVAFSPDGRTLASAGEDNRVKLWDVSDVAAPDGRLLHTLAGHDDGVHSMAFSPDGRQLATVGNVEVIGPFLNAAEAHAKSYATVKLWEVASGKPLATWQTKVVSLLTFLPEGQLLTVTHHTPSGIRVAVCEQTTGKELRQLLPKAEGWYAAVSPNGTRLALADKAEIKVWDLTREVLIRFLKGHTEKQTNGLAFSPDGQRLSSAGQDGTVLVWDLGEREPTPVTWRGHEGWVYHAPFSPDGLRLASIGEDGLVQVWDAGARGPEARGTKRGWGTPLAFTPDGRRLLALGESPGAPELWDVVSGQKLSAPRGGGGPVVYSPNGSWLASGSPDGIRLWDATTGREARTIPGTQGCVGLAFAPDGRLASARDGAVQVWDPASGRELLTFKIHARVVEGVAFSPDGRRLAAGSYDSRPGEGPSGGTLNVWDAAGGRVLLTFEVHTGGVRGVAFSPDGRLLATAGFDRDGTDTVKLWDADTGQGVRTIPWPKEPLMAVAFSPDGRLLAAAGGHRLRVWDVASGQEVFTYQSQKGQALALAFSPDGRRLVSGDLDLAVKVWDLATGKERLVLSGGCSALAFSPDGLRLAAGSVPGRVPGGGPVRVWDTASSEELHSLGGHVGGVRCAALSPDGRRVASGGGDHVVRLWDLETWQPLRAFPGHTAAVSAVAFSPDGRLLASGAGEFGKWGEVRIWDLASGQELHHFPGLPDQVSKVAFSPDGGRLVSVGTDGTVKVWATATGPEVQTCKLPLPLVRGVAFSPDGRLLACAGRDSRVRLWDLAGGREVRPLTGHAARDLTAVAFSPDGRRLVSAGDDSVRLWDVATGQELYAFTRGAGALAFSPDGGLLAASGGLVWDGRELTPEREAEREALGLLDDLFSRPLPRRAVLEEVRTCPSLGEPVRRRALELAAHYREEEDPQHYAEAARALARQAHLPVYWYRRALSQAEAACEHAPEEGYCLTGLGMARYRLGKYAEALQALTRADRLNAELPGGPFPADLALLALTQHRLGHPDEARGHLARLRERMKDNRWGQDEEARALLREAELRIEDETQP